MLRRLTVPVVLIALSLALSGAPAAVRSGSPSPPSGGFRPAGSMPGYLSSHAATLLSDGRAFVVGGHGQAGYLASAEAWEPAPSPFPTDQASPSASPVPVTPIASVDPAAPPGPPYPDPIDGVHVYDHAGRLSAETVASLTATIGAIEARTGVDIVVYTQVKPASDTTAKAESDAAALMDQWAAGRPGIDDGLIILFDLSADPCHGQVQLYAGPGSRAAYLTHAERQRIYEVDMLPALRDCDLDAALLAAMERIDEGMNNVRPDGTPETLPLEG